MKDVYLNFANNSPLNSVVLIDGKKLKATKNEQGNQMYHYQTEKESVNVKIYSYTEMSSKLWYFFSILYFFISVFGIFDARPKKNGMSLKAEYNYKISEDKNFITISYNPIQLGKPAITSKSELEEMEITNEFFVDQLLVKRYKRAKLIRMLILLTLIVTGITLLFVLL